MKTKDRTSIPDYQRQFSVRNIKNYIAQALMPFFTNGLSSMLFSTYLTFVYTEYLGVAAALISVVVSIGVVIDAVSDFIMGAIADRCISRWGKAKHWFFISALPMFICMLLMFMVPEAGSQTLKVAWVFVFYNLFCTVNTTCRVPSNALPSLVSDNPKVRGNMAFAFNLTASIATASLGWIVTPLLTTMGESLHTFRIATAICAGISMVTMLISGLLITEQRSKEEWAEIQAQYRAMHHLEKNESIWQQIGNLFKNKWWILFLFIGLLGGCGIGFQFGVIAYWIQFVVGDVSYTATLMSAMNIPTMIGVFLFPILLQKLSTKKVAIGTVFLRSILALGMWICGASNLTILTTLMVISSFVGGTYSPVAMTVVPDIIDYGEWKTGSRQDGLCNSGTMLANKIMSAIATALTGIILTATGYSGGGVASPAAVSAINFLFLGVPCITSFITVVLWFFYKLDTKQAEQYRAEVKARNAARKQDF